MLTLNEFFERLLSTPIDLAGILRIDDFKYHRRQDRDPFEAINAVMVAWLESEELGRLVQTYDRWLICFQTDVQRMCWAQTKNQHSYETKFESVEHELPSGDTANVYSNTPTQVPSPLEMLLQCEGEEHIEAVSATADAIICDLAKDGKLAAHHLVPFRAIVRMFITQYPVTWAACIEEHAAGGIDRRRVSDYWRLLVLPELMRRLP